ncbi:MAG: HAD family hydrolase [Halothiobacillus sp.]
MLAIDIPGGAMYRFAHLVLDFNGTLAEDGALIDGVAARITALAESLEIHVITADTNSSAARVLAGLPITLKILGSGAQDQAKADFVQELGAQCVAVGNGRNDAVMLHAAALGIVVIQAECAARVTVDAADLVSHSIQDTLDLLLNPKRLIATLRN